LLELLVVIAILAILATIGIPNFGPTVANSRATAAANDLLGALQLARSEAVRLNEPVEINPTEGNWAAGWTIERNAAIIRQREALARVTITVTQRIGV
jgi:type IV fimbrial biogenesis protein FimT